MAIKKNEMYTSLYAACDELRGGMDPSQYKNYILRLLFVKYVSDKFKGVPYAEIEIPEGGSYDDILKYRGNKNIGEEIDKVIAKLAEANDLYSIIAKDFSFNDETKLGSGKDMVDKLTALVNIFNRPEFNFKNNKSGGDDILGDAYEYLMRRFAVDSGKSKGQFYTPAEVSRILAKVIGIDEITERAEDWTVYDPACGSGSLLIRAVNEAPFEIAPYGQELDEMTAGLAKMNLVLHNKATGEIAGNKSTLSHPQYFEEGSDNQVLRRFDFIVMNPPFSLKNWTNGYKDYGRCEGFGAMPPEKKGDFAWFLHVIKSLKRTGKAAIILPHGVLFRGNAEETIRKSIVDKGLIKAIISLPPNIFYGTNIAAAVIVIDKEDADERDGIFMIDASHDFVKDGNKNRLREQDIYKIVTTYKNRITTDATYARFVPNEEIKIKNNYNLNISRYIDSANKEDIQDIEAHLHGGIPFADVDSLNRFWSLFPQLKHTLFSEMRDGYYKVNVDINEIRNAVYNDVDFIQYADKIERGFAAWEKEVEDKLRGIDESIDTKQLISDIAEVLVKEFEPLTLLNKYDVYEVLLSYWNETMSDDAMVVKYDGYAAGKLAPDIVLKKVNKKTKEEEEKVVGWEGKLIPKILIESTYFSNEREEINKLKNKMEEAQGLLAEWIEEQSGEEGVLADKADGSEKEIKVTTEMLAEMLADIQSKTESEEISALEEFLFAFDENSMKKKEYMAYIKEHPLCQSTINEKGNVTKKRIVEAIIEARSNTPVKEVYREDYEELIKAYVWAETIETAKKDIKIKETELDNAVRTKYAELTDEEIKDLLINKKWFMTIERGINALYLSVSHILSGRVTELAKRYEYTLSELTVASKDYENKIKSHLELIKQCTIQEFLTGKKRLSGFSGEWINVNMSKNSKIKARIGWQGLTTAEYLDAGYALLVTGTDFANGKINWSGCHYVTKERFDQDTNIQIKNDDILITKDGTIGKIARVAGLTQPATLNSGVFVVRPMTNVFTSGFLFHILMSNVFKKFIKELTAGSTIVHLYQKDIVKFSFFVPPTIEEQNAITKIIDDMDNEINELNKKLEKYRLIKQGMMQKLLTGEIRLV